MLGSSTTLIVFVLIAIAELVIAIAIIVAFVKHFRNVTKIHEMTTEIYNKIVLEEESSPTS